MSNKTGSGGMTVETGPSGVMVTALGIVGGAIAIPLAMALLSISFSLGVTCICMGCGIGGCWLCRGLAELVRSIGDARANVLLADRQGQAMVIEANGRARAIRIEAARPVLIPDRVEDRR